MEDKIFVPFEEWVKQFEIQRCEGCLGAGELECSCCGETNICADCGGKGQVYAGMSENMARREYGEQCQKDLARLQELNGDK